MNFESWWKDCMETDTLTTVMIPKDTARAVWSAAQASLINEQQIRFQGLDGERRSSARTIDWFKVLGDNLLRISTEES